MLELGTLRNVRVEIPDTGQHFEIWMPSDFDSLLDQAEADPEQNLPYWAELWPSGIALAAHVLENAESLCNVRTIELGCGLGVTAIAAMRCGADLIATDYSPESLALCEANCVRNGAPAPAFVQMNWRQPEADYFAHVGNGVPLVLAADVLYEERDVAPLIELVEATLSSQGELWLAEPGRRPAASFMEQILARGWRSSSTRYTGPWPDPEDNDKGVVVAVHRVSRAG